MKPDGLEDMGSIIEPVLVLLKGSKLEFPILFSYTKSYWFLDLVLTIGKGLI